MGWKIGPEVVYLAEGNAADTGKAIKWAQELGKQAVYNKMMSFWPILALLFGLCRCLVVSSKQLSCRSTSNKPTVGYLRQLSSYLVNIVDKRINNPPGGGWYRN